MAKEDSDGATPRMIGIGNLDEISQAIKALSRRIRRAQLNVLYAIAGRRNRRQLESPRLLDSDRVSVKEVHEVVRAVEDGTSGR